MRGLDYGSGMAYNFFYGYLRLVLPEGGTPGTKGLLFYFLFTITHGMSFVIANLEN
jgi:hypothetical protein